MSEAILVPRVGTKLVLHEILSHGRKKFIDMKTITNRLRGDVLHICVAERKWQTFKTTKRLW